VLALAACLLAESVFVDVGVVLLAFVFIVVWFDLLEAAAADGGQALLELLFLNLVAVVHLVHVVIVQLLVPSPHVLLPGRHADWELLSLQVDADGHSVDIVHDAKVLVCPVLCHHRLAHLRLAQRRELALH